MDLQDVANLAKIISSIATVIIMGISVTVAIFLYKWQKETAKINSIQKINDDLRFYNQLVLESDELLEMEAKAHRWGTLNKAEVKKMYCYFILFNVSYNGYEAGCRGAIRKSVYESQINNLANTTFDDRDFIKKHVLPRGYSNEFREEVASKWRKIDSKGTLQNV